MGFTFDAPKTPEVSTVERKRGNKDKIELINYMVDFQKGSKMP